MTFSLRRKHPTTARGPRSLIRTAISLFVVAAAFHARPAPAQSYNYGYPAPPDPAAPPGQPASRPVALQFSHENSPAVVQVVQKDKGGKEGEQPPAKQEYLNLE